MFRTLDESRGDRMTPFFAIGTTILSAVYFVVVGLGIGFPLTRVFEADARARLLVAPALGLAFFGVVGALTFHVLPLSLGGIALVIVLSAGLAALIGRGAAAPPLFHTQQAIGPAWLIAALALALVAAFANAPHIGAAGVALGETAFDHAKVAIVDEIARNGLPAHNPFYQQAGSANLLNYYYLWYLMAATAESVTGARGWEADVALTGATAFISLTTLAWAAMAYGRCAAAAWWVLAIAGAGTLRLSLALVAGNWLRAHITDEHRLEGWIEQAPWVPQHLLAATFAFLAIFGVVALLKRDVWAPSSAVIVGVLIAASYDSSIWIGGFGLAAILPVLALIGLWTQAKARSAVLANLATTVVVALAFAAVFLIRNLSVLGHRKTIALWTYPVLVGADGSVGLHLANELAFWLFVLVIDFGFAYLLTIAWCLGLRRLWAETRDLLHPALALAFVLPLLLAQFIVSVIANNDFGWRIVLIAVFSMTTVAASTAARLMASAARPWVLAAAVLCLAPSLASGVAIGLRFDGVDPLPALKADPRFADQADLWRAVRAVTPPDQAVLNNPKSFATMTAWPGNIGWALLSNRRSCAAGWQWLRSLAPDLLPDDLRRLDDRIDRVFDGHATAEDFRALKDGNLCRTLVVVPTDPLWASALMADNPFYTLVDSREGRWRLYR